MLYNTFEKVYVVNLSRRKERLTGFLNCLPEDWPFRTPERFQAIDGGLTTYPGWWRGGEGAWGCYRSHLRILEDCLNNEIESVLILEDDAVCVDDFKRKTEEFWQHLPSDWAMVYLGGQHLEENICLPRKVNDKVYQPFNINRTHCFGIRGRKMLSMVYQHLQNVKEWNVDHHIDHYLGVLHKKVQTGLYVPDEWLVYQDEGDSDVCCKKVETKKYQGAGSLSDPSVTLPGIAILGGYFGGTNTIAGAMDALGIFMGNDIARPENSDELRFYEDHWLAVKCRNSYSEPWLIEKTNKLDRINQLKHWAGTQCQSVKNDAQFFCGKHPILSLMGNELIAAWNNPKFIVVDRSDKQCAESLSQVPWNWHPNGIRRAIRVLREEREVFLENQKPCYLRIDFEKSQKNPVKLIDEISQFVNHTPDNSQYAKAKELIVSNDNDMVRM